MAKHQYALTAFFEAENLEEAQEIVVNRIGDLPAVQHVKIRWMKTTLYDEMPEEGNGEAQEEDPTGT